MSSQKEQDANEKPDHVIEIDLLLPFQTMNIEINNMGQKPFDHCWKFFSSNEKDALTGQIEDLLTQHITKNYSAKEQEMMEVNVKASAKADFLAEVDDLDKKVDPYFRHLTPNWFIGFSIASIKQLAKQFGVSLSELKTKAEMIQVLRDFRSEFHKLNIYLLRKEWINPNETTQPSISLNVIQYAATKLSIPFDESATKESLLELLKVAIKKYPNGGLTGTTGCTGSTGFILY